MSDRPAARPALDLAAIEERWRYIMSHIVGVGDLKTWKVVWEDIPLLLARVRGLEAQAAVWHAKADEVADLLAQEIQRGDAAEARLGRLVAALEFYADLDAYYDEYGHTDFAAGDAGARARAALAPDARDGAAPG